MLKGFQYVINLASLDRFTSRPKVTMLYVIGQNPSRIVIFKDERSAGRWPGNRSPRKKCGNHILETAVYEVDRRQTTNSTVST